VYDSCTRAFRELRLRVRLLPRTLEPTLHRTPHVCSGHKQVTPVALAPLPQEYAGVVAYSPVRFHAFDKKSRKSKEKSLYLPERFLGWSKIQIGCQKQKYLNSKSTYYYLEGNIIYRQNRTTHKYLIISRPPSVRTPTHMWLCRLLLCYTSITQAETKDMYHPRSIHRDLIT
jgi:hypothetical protein